MSTDLLSFEHPSVLLFCLWNSAFSVLAAIWIISLLLARPVVSKSNTIISSLSSKCKGSGITRVVARVCSLMEFNICFIGDTFMDTSNLILFPALFGKLYPSAFVFYCQYLLVSPFRFPFLVDSSGEFSCVYSRRQYCSFINLNKENQILWMALFSWVPIFVDWAKSTHSCL